MMCTITNNKGRGASPPIRQDVRSGKSDQKKGVPREEARLSKVKYIL